MFNPLIEEAQLVVEACELILLEFESYLKRRDAAMVQCNDYNTICATILAEMIQGFLIHGTYAVSSLPNDDAFSLIENLLKRPSIDAVILLGNSLARLYGRNTEIHANRIVSELIKRKRSPNLDVSATIETYFIKVTEQTNV